MEAQLGLGLVRLSVSQIFDGIHEIMSCQTSCFRGKIFHLFSQLRTNMRALLKLIESFPGTSSRIYNDCCNKYGENLNLELILFV